MVDMNDFAVSRTVYRLKEIDRSRVHHYQTIGARHYFAENLALIHVGIYGDGVTRHHDGPPQPAHELEDVGAPRLSKYAELVLDTHNRAELVEVLGGKRIVVGIIDVDLDPDLVRIIISLRPVVQSSDEKRLIFVGNPFYGVYQIIGKCRDAARAWKTTADETDTGPYGPYYVGFSHLNAPS
jgi:hypothetical protein